MSKSKSSTIPNKALHSRVSYLYQAASYLATVQNRAPAQKDCNHNENEGTQSNEHQPHMAKVISQDSLQPASRRLVSDLRAVSLKMQMRMSPAMKHTICKNCDTLLIDGSTCTNIVENKSKGGKKPWADVLVRKCTTCGFTRRFPINAPRQKRRPCRSEKLELFSKSDTEMA